MSWCNTTDFVVVMTWIAMAVAMAVAMAASCVCFGWAALEAKEWDEKVRFSGLACVAIAVSFALGLIASVITDASVLWECG